MKFQLLTVAALGPLVAFASQQPHRRRHKCGSKPSTTAATTTTTITTTSTITATAVTTGLPLSEFSTVSAVPDESLTTATTTYSTDYISTNTETPTTTITTGLPLSEIPSFTAVPASSLTETTLSKHTIKTPPVEAATPAESAAPPASEAVDGPYAKATPVASKQPPKQQCGNNDRLLLPGEPWTVANSMYNANQMVGKQCTNYEGILQAADGTKVVKYTSVTDVQLVDSTKDVCKGYTNVGVGVNLNNKLKDIKSIPAYFQWERSNTTAFRGSNLFDFITAPTPHDGTSPATSEFMLWIRNWGNQVPIGFSRGPVATFDNLFGASWKLYEGKNPASGVTVRSMLVDTNYDGEFQGDLKDWLNAMVQKGYISDDQYVTVGNAGTEIFYGDSVMDATVALNINV
ncbi:glycoside hydrolase family 12 protein [Nemania sp. FL0916]|nr:glycoside hydrolase family 12 protein [Nemania sp. FL0916]